MVNSNKSRLIRIIALLIILTAIFGGGGWYIELNRRAQRSALSGFFESQPTLVSSRIGGRVSRILIDEGDAVHKGQPLIELNVTPDRDETQARLAAADQAREQLLEVENGPRWEDIKKQEAAVAEAQANLAHLVNGPRPEEIAEARAAELNAKAHLDQAMRGLTPEERAEAKARVDAADSQKDMARLDADRMRQLYTQGAISRQQFDQAQTNLRDATAKWQEQEQAWTRAKEGTPAEEMRQARESYLEAKAALDLVLAGSRKEDIRAAQDRLKEAQATLTELKAGSRPEEIAQARAAAQAAEDTARSSQADLAERTVRGSRDGAVERTLVAVGDLVTPDTPLLRLDDPNDIWVRVYIPEARLANVTVGSRARLRVDGVAGPVAAYVESIASRGEFTPANLQTPSERGKQVFAVRLRLVRPDSRVKAGMYATVTRIGNWQP